MTSVRTHRAPNDFEPGNDIVTKAVFTIDEAGQVDALGLQLVPEMGEGKIWFRKSTAFDKVRKHKRSEYTLSTAAAKRSRHDDFDVYDGSQGSYGREEGHAGIFAMFRDMNMPPLFG